ncbi:50S ribosomal protein L25 [compost metagenome]
MSQSLRVTDRTMKSKQMRSQGQVPAVVYSNRMDNVLVAVEEKQLLSVLKRSPHAIFELDLPEQGKQPVMVHEVQRDALTGQLLHIDFLQINMKEKIDAPIIIHYTGEPAGVKEGGILQVDSYEITVRCMPSKLPSSIEADISELGIGGQLLVSDLKLPNNVELITDPESMLVTILAIQKLDEAIEPTDSTDSGGDAAEQAEETVK